MLAFIFPGQGAQYVGMGKDIYEKYPAGRAVFDQADAVLGFALSKLCFEGPEEELRLTMNTQPALLTVSVALSRVLREVGVRPEMAAGHSLGEYCALVAAEAMDFADALTSVRKRGQFMQEAVPVGEGAMAAVLGLPDGKVVEICRQIESTGQIVQAVNFNCPGQVVVAGQAAAVDTALTRLKEGGAKRVMLLPVSAPFHSALMLPAAEKLGEFLAKITFRDAKIPVYSNVTGRAVQDRDEIKTFLVRQAASPVLWTNLAAAMAEDGATALLEVGPGKTLSGFAKKITPDLPVNNVADNESLDNYLKTRRK
jgi:[acyl-carrier-protein] S-malonyltransferase